MFDYLWGEIGIVVIGMWLSALFLMIGVGIGKRMDKRQLCRDIQRHPISRGDSGIDICVERDQEILALAKKLHVKIGGEK